MFGLNLKNNNNNKATQKEMITTNDDLVKPQTSSTDGLRKIISLTEDEQMIENHFHQNSERIESPNPSSSDQDLEDEDDIDEIMLDFVGQDQADDGLSLASSINSIDCVYAYRGRIDLEIANHDNHPIHPHPENQQQNDEEETDFLEMDFDEPETNSEIENFNGYENNEPTPLNGDLSHLKFGLPPCQLQESGIEHNGKNSFINLQFASIIYKFFKF